MSTTSTETVTEVKRGRGRPRTKSITRKAPGVFESKDGRFRITGTGKVGRRQDFLVEDLSLPKKDREDEAFVATSLAQVEATLTQIAPESVN